VKLFTDLPPRVITTSKTFWKAVGLIAGSRARSRRSSGLRVGGIFDEALSEVAGVWAELSSWKWLDDSECPNISPALVRPEWPAAGANISVSFDGHKIGIDSKAWTPFKPDKTIADPFSTLNINVSGHAKSYQRGNDYYIFSFGSIGGPATIVGSPYPHEIIAGWETSEGKYGGPYYQKSIKDLIPVVVSGKSAWKMSSWIEKTSIARQDGIQLVSAGIDLSEEHDSATAEACRASSFSEFIELVEGI
jgi:hypothetical protein